jgi:O-acetylserine/cysteine efflux transporter
VLCGGPLHFALVYWGFQLADNLSAYAVVLQMWIPFVAVLAWALLGERMGRAELLGLAVAFAGVAFMALDGGGLGEDWDSIVVGTVASFFWAAAVVLARRTSDLPPLKMQGIISVFAAPTMLAGGLWRAPDSLDRLVEASPLIWACLVWAGRGVDRDRDGPGVLARPGARGGTRHALLPRHARCCQG